MNILYVYSDKITFNDAPVAPEDLDNIFRKWNPHGVELFGDYFTNTMVEAVRLALRHKVTVHGNSNATVRGMDQVVTGGLQAVN